MAVLAIFVLGGCATKRDLKEVRDELRTMRVRQDSLLQLLERQNAALMDSVASTGALVVQTRGDLAHQLLEMEEQMMQIQELTGQGQRRLAELRQDYERRTRELERAPARPAPGEEPTAPMRDTAAAQADAQPPAGGSPDELYRVGREQLERGNFGTARRAFQMLLREAPSHEQAPAAQFGIAETYVQEDPDRAVRELERVVELYPDSRQAPAALYRAGVISEDRGNIGAAREYFQKVIAGYPGSEASAGASERLRGLRN